MRIILDNDDAQSMVEELNASDQPPRLALKIPDERLDDGSAVTVCVNGAEFNGRARRTPGEPGGIFIEGEDGRLVLEAD